MAATEIYTNNATTTVSSGGTTASSGSQTWTVASSATFPAAATGVSQFHVGDPAQPTELIVVTNVSSNTWTVTRGAESTTPVAHAQGFTVASVITAGGLNGLLSGASGPLAVTSGGIGTARAACSLMKADRRTAHLRRCRPSPGSGRPECPDQQRQPSQLPTWPGHPAFISPMTTPGDMIDGGASGAATRLAGNTTSTKNFLTSTGSGGTANTPGWGTIAASDVPVLNQNTTRTSSNETDIVEVVSSSTGLGSVTAYAVVTGGATSTSSLQTVAALGSSGQVLTSQGAGSLPVFQTIPTGTTSAAGILQLDGTATDIQPLGTQAAGGKGQPADAQHVHPLPAGFYPADAGYLEWSYDPVVISASTALAGTASIYLVRINIRVARTVTNVVTYLGTLGGGLTTGENFAGLYSSGGSLIGTSADQASSWNTGSSTGVKTVALTGGPFSVPAGFCWAAFMYNGSTAPSFGRAFNVTAAISNAGFAATTARFATATGGTVLPGTINTSNNSLNATEYWAALS